MEDLMTKEWFFLVLLSLFPGAFAEAASTEWLVRLPPSLRSLKSLEARAQSCLEGLASMSAPEEMGVGGWKFIRFAEERTHEELLRSCETLEWEANQRFVPWRAKPDLVPIPESSRGEDPELQRQWGLQDIKALGIPEGPGALVAVLDTGVDYNHPDLQSALWKNPGETGLDARGRPKESNGIDDDGNGFVDDVMGWDFVDNDNKPFDQLSWSNEGHGTHLTGLIAARAGNGLGIRGVSPETSVMVLRFIDTNGYGTTASAIRALRYAIQQGAKILNISWGGDEAGVTASQALKDAFVEAERAGLLIVVAAGNGSVDLDQSPERSVPASYRLRNMIVVAASGPGGHRATFSNFGAASVDLAAPGVGILSTVPGGGVGLFDGSSVAVPHVAAALSRMWGASPRLDASRLKEALLESVTPTPVLRQRVRTSGRLNMENLWKGSLKKDSFGPFSSR